MRNVLIFIALLLTPVAFTLAQNGIPGTPPELQALCVMVLLIAPLLLVVMAIVVRKVRRDERAKAAAEKTRQEKEQAEFIQKELKKFDPAASKGKFGVIKLPVNKEGKAHYLTYAYLDAEKVDKKRKKDEE